MKMRTSREEVTKILRQDGVDIVLNAKTTRVGQSDGSIRLEVQSRDGATALVGSHLLVATGRMPNSDTLNLGSRRSSNR